MCVFLRAAVYVALRHTLYMEMHDLCGASHAPAPRFHLCSTLTRDVTAVIGRLTRGPVRLSEEILTDRDPVALRSKGWSRARLLSGFRRLMFPD